MILSSPSHDCRRPGRYALPVFALLLISTLLPACARNPVTGDTDFVLMSEEQEVAIGRKNHAEVLKHYTRYDNEELQAYVDRIGQQVAQKSHRTNLIYRFTVLDSQEVNAFALPGGYIYITRGLLAYMKTEAQLAAVLGHEIGHVTARHSVRQHATGTATSILATIISSKAGTQSAQDLTNILGTAFIRGYGRDMELEADELGAEYLARTGYEPQAMLDVIGILKNQETVEISMAKQENREPRVYHGLFSTHPDNDERLNNIVRKADQYKPAATAGTARQAQNGFLQKIDNMVFGSSRNEGVLRGNRFYHADLDIFIQFPAGWIIKNLPDRLVAYDQQSNAFIQVFANDRNLKISPKEFVEKRLSVGEISQGESLTINGAEAFTGLARIRTSHGAVTSRISAAYLGDKAYVFIGYPKNDNQFARYEKDFVASAGSLRRMDRQERALAEPMRIHLMRAERGTTFRQLADRSRLSSYAEETLRLINQHYPVGEPQAGDWIKTVR